MSDTRASPQIYQNATQQKDLDEMDCKSIARQTKACTWGDGKTPTSGSRCGGRKAAAWVLARNLPSVPPSAPPTVVCAIRDIQGLRGYIRASSLQGIV